MMPGRVEGRSAILAYDLEQADSQSAYFIMFEFFGAELGSIRYFRCARYAMTDARWEVFG